MTRRRRHAPRLTLALVTALAGLSGCGHDDAGLPIVGTLERHRLALPAYAAEPLLTLQVHEGDQVRVGQRLATLDPATLNARRAGVAAQVEHLKAQLAELTHGPRVELLLESRQRLARTQATLANAEAERKRVLELVRQRLVSRSLADERTLARDQARASVGEASAQLQALLKGTRAEQLDQARAALNAMQAQLLQIDVERARLDVLAPQDGVVEALPYRVGERPGVGAPVVIMLADEVPFARVYVPESLRAAFVPGTTVQVHVDGVAKPQPGRVRYVAKEASFTPYFALTQKDRGNLVFIAEVDVTDPGARHLPVGIPLEIHIARPNDGNDK